MSEADKPGNRTSITFGEFKDSVILMREGLEKLIAEPQQIIPLLGDSGRLARNNLLIDRFLEIDSPESIIDKLYIYYEILADNQKFSHKNILNRGFSLALAYALCESESNKYEDYIKNGGFTLIYPKNGGIEWKCYTVYKTETTFDIDFKEKSKEVGEVLAEPLKVIVSKMDGRYKEKSIYLTIAIGETEEHLQKNRYFIESLHNKSLENFVYLTAKTSDLINRQNHE